MNRSIWLLTIVVLAGGFLVGYAMSRGGAEPVKSTEGTGSATSSARSEQSRERANRDEHHEAGTAAVVHRFPLTAADVKENMETATIAVTDDGAVHVAWASRVEPEKWQVFLASATDLGESFGAPRVVAESAVHRVTSQSRGKTITREVRMMPRLVSRGSELLLGWVEAVDENSAVKYFIARSADGGKTFAPPVVASTSDGARPTYTSLAASADGRLAASWLDNRRKVQLPAAAVSGADGKFNGDAIAYAPDSGKGVCPCCPTSVTFGDDGTLYLAFRNQQDGFRDMWIARLRPGGSEFDAPKPVVSPTWMFDGCPHDGPSLAVQKGQLQIAWMDAHSGQPRVYLAHGDSSIEQLEKQEVDPAAAYSQGHPALASSGGTLYLAWDEGSGAAVKSEATVAASAEATSRDGHGHGTAPAAGETSRAVRLATFSRDGHRLSDPQPVAPVSGTFQSRPSVAVHSSGEVYVGWVELSSQGKSIAVARLKRAPATKAMAQDGSR